MQWLIDGHNLIGQMPGLRLDDPDDEAKLIDYLRRYCARTGHRLTVIFDAGAGYHLAETKKQGGLTIQFAAQGQTADHLIQQRLARVNNPQAVMVVSSDQAVQQAARHARVRAIASAEFARQLLQTLTGSASADPDERAEVKLSADEVDEWLKFFNNRKQGSSQTNASHIRNPATSATPGRTRSGTGPNQKRTGRGKKATP
ncbi:MAG: NYN domain-containing protein [Anaerolineae bacterium]